MRLIEEIPVPVITQLHSNETQFQGSQSKPNIEVSTSKRAFVLKNSTSTDATETPAFGSFTKSSQRFNRSKSRFRYESRGDDTLEIYDEL